MNAVPKMTFGAKFGTIRKLMFLWSCSVWSSSSVTPSIFSGALDAVRRQPVFTFSMVGDQAARTKYCLVRLGSVPVS